MRLILTTPALQAHSVLRYAQWRQVIADYVATRLGTSPNDMTPRIVAQTSLAIALTAYESWLANDSTNLHELLDTSMTQLRHHLAI